MIYYYFQIYLKILEICLVIYELDPAYFVFAPGLAWQVCLKKAGVKLELLTDYDMILMIEKGVRGGICQTTQRYAKANNKYVRIFANNLYGWAMSQKISVNDFKWIKKEELSKFKEDFIKNYDENGKKGYFLEVDIDYLKELFNLHKIYHFYPRVKK